MDMNVHSCVTHNSQNLEIEVQQWMKVWYAGWNTILLSKGQPTLLTHSALTPHSSRPVLHSFTSKTRRNRWFWLASLSCPFCHTRLFQRLFLCLSLSGWSPCCSLNTSSTTLPWGHNTIRKLLTPMAKMHGCLLYLLNECFTYHLLQTLITPPPLFSPSFSDFSQWNLSTNKLDSFGCLLARL